MERKSIILFVFLALTVFCKAQDGGYHGYVYKIPQFANAYNRIASFDTNGYLKPIPNGVGYLHNNNGVFSYSVSSGSYVTSIAFSGTTTQTLTLNQVSGGTLTASFSVSALPEGGINGDVLYRSGGVVVWANLCDLVTACIGGLVSRVETLEEKVGYMEEYLSQTDSTSIPPINYGYLYNWYAATDSRKISSSDNWVVPTRTQLATLRTNLGLFATSGGKLKEIGYVYWDSPNTGATNEVKFNARGSGLRSGANGQYINNKVENRIWSITAASASGAYFGWLRNDDQVFVEQDDAIINGNCIRLLRSSTSLTDGQTGTYVGNDGKIYRTICIGTQEWLADNLAETKYRNGNWITGFDGGVYTPISNAAWAAKTTEAMCVYNDDESNR